MRSRIKALLDTVGQVMIGAAKDWKLLADDVVTKQRLTQCGKCTYLDFEHLSCKACKCKVAYKSRLLASRCPKGKW